MVKILCKKILYQNDLNRKVIIEKQDNKLIKITLQTPMKGGPYSQKVSYVPYSGDNDVQVFL